LVSSSSEVIQDRRLKPPKKPTPQNLKKMPGSYSFIDTLLPLTQERFFGDINSNGNIALPFNETQLVQAVVVLAVLVVVAIILSQLGLFSIPEFFANKSQKRFDHMRPEHQGFRPEHPKMESRYRRDLTGKFILQFFFLFFFQMAR
jgi:hypothetical protein